MLDQKINSYKESNSAGVLMTKESVKTYISAQLDDVYKDILDKLKNKDNTSIIIGKLQGYSQLGSRIDINGPSGLSTSNNNTEGGAFIFTIQTSLTAMGFDIGQIDGLFREGGKTQSGVKAFQKSYNTFNHLTPGMAGYLKPDGYPGIKTTKAIYDMINKWIAGEYSGSTQPEIPTPARSTRPVRTPRTSGPGAGGGRTPPAARVEAPPAPAPESTEVDPSFQIPGLTHDANGEVINRPESLFHNKAEQVNCKRLIDSMVFKSQEEKDGLFTLLTSMYKLKVEEQNNLFDVIKKAQTLKSKHEEEFIWFHEGISQKVGRRGTSGYIPLITQTELEDTNKAFIGLYETEMLTFLNLLH